MLQRTELKNQLYNSIKQSGLQSELQKHLRIQICQKLRQKDKIRLPNQHQELYYRIFVSLLSEEMILFNCTYAQSVYVAEAGYDDKILNRAELVEIMGLKQSILNQEESILSNLLQKQYPFNKVSQKNIQIQTNPQDIGYTMEQKLMLIDQQYRINIRDGNEKVYHKVTHQNYEQKYKKQYERNLQRFKQFEAHSIKVKVGEQWRKKYEQLSTALQQQFKNKMDNLRKKQKLLREQLAQKHKILSNKEESVQRISQQKLQLLEMKHNTVQTEMKNITSMSSNFQKEATINKAQLQQKRNQYQQLLIGLQKKIEYEVNIAKLVMQQEQQEKQIESMRKKKFIDEEYGKLMGIKEATDLIQKQNQRLHEENQLLRQQNTILQRNLKDLVSQMAVKVEQVSQLKQQNVQKSIREYEIINNKKKQEKKMKKTQKDVLALREELEEFRGQKQKMQAIQPLEKANITSQRTLKVEKLRQDRKKDIQKFKLQTQ